MNVTLVDWLIVFEFVKLDLASLSLSESIQPQSMLIYEQQSQIVSSDLVCVGFQSFAGSLLLWIICQTCSPLMYLYALNSSAQPKQVSRHVI